MDNEVLVAIIVSSVTLLTAAGRAIWVVYTHKERKQQSTKVDFELSRHPLFAQLDESENSMKDSFECIDKKKEALAREATIHYIKVWREALIELAKNLDSSSCTEKKCDCSDAVIFTHHINTFNTAVGEYMDWRSNDYVSVHGVSYDEESKESMDLFMKKFKKWNIANEKITRESIKKISNSPSYDNCKLKHIAIFDMYLYMIQNLQINIENTLEHINGDFKDKKFLEHEKEGKSK